MTIVVVYYGDAKSFGQGLRGLILEDDNTKRKAKYQEFTLEKIRKFMLELYDDSRVGPTIIAYYRAITASMFRDGAAVAFRRRLGGSLRDTLSSIEYDQSLRPISTNMRPVRS